LKKISLLLCFLSNLSSCENIKADFMTIENKKVQLRYYITINYTSISNEISSNQGFYLKSLISEIDSFNKNLSYQKIKFIHSRNLDPVNFAMAITKELD